MSRAIRGDDDICRQRFTEASCRQKA